MKQNADKPHSDRRQNGSGGLTAAPLDLRMVTVLFADIVGSTALIEKMDAEQASAVLDPAVELAAKAVHRYGGTVIDRLGDGLMAIFGVPVNQEHHALRACQAALAIQDELRDGAFKRLSASALDINMRVGLSSGQILVKEAAEGERVTYDVSGATVHLGARIQAAAAPGTIYLSEATHRIVCHVFECRAVGPVPMKGFKGPQPLFELLRWSEDRAQRRSPKLVVPLVGRFEQLASIERAFARLERGYGGLQLITGEAGIGKSRLLIEARRVLPDNVVWLEGYSGSFNNNSSYGPFIGLLRPRLGLSRNASNDENWAALEASITELFAEEAPEVLPYIARLLGVEVREAYLESLRYLEGEVLGAQIFRAAYRLFERMGSAVVVFEDLHWSDGSALALLEHLVPLAASAPILFVITSRPDDQVLDPLRETAMHSLSGHFEEIVLTPLAPEERDRFIVAVLGDNDRTHHIRNLILQKAGGNPFFIEEVIHTLIDANLIRREVDGWSVQEHEVAIPDTIQAVVMARVDRLDDRLKALLRTASVIGRSFLYSVLRSISTPTSDVDEPLAKLAAMELIEQLKLSADLVYFFRHGLIQEAIYESLLRNKRRALHEQVAEALEAYYANRLQEVTGLLAFHYTRAEKWEKAAQYLFTAADQATGMAADDEALLQYEQAVEAYERAFGENWDITQRATIHRRLGEIYFRRGDYKRAVNHLHQVLKLAGYSFPTKSLAVALAIVHDATRHLLNLLLPHFFTMEVNDTIDPLNAEAWKAYETLGYAYNLRESRLVIISALRSSVAAQRLGYADWLAQSFATIGYSLDQIGWSQASLWYHTRSKQIAERFASPATLALTRMLSGAHFFCNGHLDEAYEISDGARRSADQASNLMLWNYASVQICDVWIQTGDFKRALAMADEMIKVGRESAFQPALRFGLVQRGRTLRQLNRYTEARSALEDAVRLASDHSDVVSGAVASADLGRLLTDLGLLDEAERVLDQMHRRVSIAKIKHYTTFYLYVSVAEFALRRFELDRSGAARMKAVRACRTVSKNAKIFPFVRAMDLRLRARLAWLYDRKRAAERLWQRAAVLAEAMGAMTELALIKRDRAACIGPAARPAAKNA
jgi:class 3 adenylate cyclase/tetratricopeptide (TPR) repeat protein